MAKPVALQREEFSTFRTVPTRLEDIDAYGHVNNVYYFTYFDTAINGWYIENRMLDIRESECVYLVVENSCMFLSELSFPDTVYAGIKLLKLGNASVRYQIALFSEDDTVAAAQGEYVHVYVNRHSKKPVSIPQSHRALLNAL